MEWWGGHGRGPRRSVELWEGPRGIQAWDGGRWAPGHCVVWRPRVCHPSCWPKKHPFMLARDPPRALAAGPSGATPRTLLLQPAGNLTHIQSVPGGASSPTCYPCCPASPWRPLHPGCPLCGPGGRLASGVSALLLVLFPPKKILRPRVPSCCVPWPQVSLNSGLVNFPSHCSTRLPPGPEGFRKGPPALASRAAAVWLSVLGAMPPELVLVTCPQRPQLVCPAPPHATQVSPGSGGHLVHDHTGLALCPQEETAQVPQGVA